MKQAISKGGTAIAFERSGRGPALILVDGALSSRAFGPMPKLRQSRKRAGPCSSWGVVGRALALEAAASGLDIKKVAAYEPPFVDEGARDGGAPSTNVSSRGCSRRGTGVAR